MINKELANKHEIQRRNLRLPGPARSTSSNGFAVINRDVVSRILYFRSPLKGSGSSRKMIAPVRDLGLPSYFPVLARVDARASISNLSLNPRISARRHFYIKKIIKLCNSES